MRGFAIVWRILVPKRREFHHRDNEFTEFSFIVLCVLRASAVLRGRPAGRPYDSPSLALFVVKSPEKFTAETLCSTDLCSRREPRRDPGFLASQLNSAEPIRQSIRS